jgi:sulfite exporter TauE/SafE
MIAHRNDRVNDIALVTLFLAGLLGSGHCVIMCGGIATALGAASGGSRLLRSTLYQLGRLTSYALAGGLVGAIGSASLSLATSRWSDIMRVATALVVVLIGLRLAFGAGSQVRWLKGPERVGARIWRFGFPLAQKCLPQAPHLRSFIVGIFWGWLPCGLVYSALLAASVAGSGMQGAAVMCAFGAGTVPAMLGIGLLGSWLPKPTGAFARLVGSVIVACGLWIAAMPLAALAPNRSHAHLHHHLSEAAPKSATTPPAR